MSDFDREAERKRLEEKYERDREKRQSTQRMSELLLKGATMTNQHCDACGSPIFRYQEQEFCPTCQAAADDAAADAATEANAEATTPETDEGADAAAATETAGDGDALDVSTPNGGANEADRPAETTNPERTAGSGAPDPTVTRDAGRPASTSPGDADSDAARASLLRALRTHADRAAETADPRRAREHLAAAHEAADALSALDG